MTIENKASLLPHPPVWKLELLDNHYTFILSGNWLAKDNNIPQLSKDVFEKIKDHHSIHFDTTGLGAWDTGLIVFLWDIKYLSASYQLHFDDKGVPESAQQLLALLTENKPPTVEQEKHTFRPLFHLGGWAINALGNVGMTSSILTLSIRGTIRSFMGRSQMRLVDLIRDTRAAGPSAFIIISVVNFLIGAILAFVGAVQLRKFSADIYVANLVGIATIREMAAVMTAIVISGRTGGAYAARIATMQGNEEIDALKVMGISVAEYLILPSMLSLVITMPLLYLYGCFMGVFGGLVVSLLMLKVSTVGFLLQVCGAVPLDQFVFGGIKTVAFAMFIGISSCHIGIKAGRSAADVGIAATKAVVTGIVGVIALDAVFAVLADMIGI